MSDPLLIITILFGAYMIVLNVMVYDFMRKLKRSEPKNNLRDHK